MKFDAISIVQIFTLLSAVTLYYGYFNNLSISKNKYKTTLILEQKDTIRVSYSKTFIIDNYKTFEKIDVWRYCTKF